MPIVIQRGDCSLARQVKEQICDLYDAVFSSSPFAWNPSDSQEHSETMDQMMSLSTFEVTVAFDGCEVVGFAYGHRLPVTHGWWSGFPEPLPADFTREWEGRTFTLVDFAVSARFRGTGVGRKLHNLLLGRRPEERAVLSVQPAATETHHIYEHMGWTRVGRKGPIEGVQPPYWDIFVLPLSALRDKGRPASQPRIIDMDVITAVQLMPVLSRVLDGMTEGAGSQLWESLTHLLGRGRRRDPQLASVMRAATDNPGDKELASTLASIIEARSRADAVFAGQLRDWFAAASREFPSQTNVNSISGTVSGPVVQAHEIHGDITF